MTDNKKKHLYNMNELSDYKISDGYPDVRGWDVKDFDNRVIGTVDNLLVNLDAERVVYLDVEVDKSIIDAKHDPYGRPTHLEVREFVNKEGENHIIIPIGLVDLNDDSNYVYTDILDHQTFSETKRYRKGDNIDRSYENQVLSSYRRKDRNAEQKNNLYEDKTFTDDKDAYDNDFQEESRLREIVRGEIRRYHRNDDTQNQNNHHTSEERDDAVLTDEGTIKNEPHLREIIREEIREYHRKRDTDNLKNRRYIEDDNDSLLTDEERDLERRRKNDDVNDDDRFYERREFDDTRFGKKRTPGL